jgi:hypothetical protein
VASPPSTLLDSRSREQGYLKPGGIGTNAVGALGILEWAFIAFVGAMTALAGVFALYVLLQVFRNPSRRSSSR